MSYTALLVGGPDHGKLRAIPGGSQELRVAILRAPLMTDTPWPTTINVDDRIYRRELLFTSDPDGVRWRLTCMLWDELWRTDDVTRLRAGLGALMRFVPHVEKLEDR